MHQRSYLCRVKLSVFHNLFGQRALVKYKFRFLPFAFLFRMTSVVASSSWKVKRRLQHVYKSPFDTCQIERYLEPDIVLTGNDAEGVNLVPRAFWNEVRVGVAKRTSLGSEFCNLLYRKLPSSPAKLAVAGLRSSLCLSRWNSLLSSFPGLQHRRRPVSQVKTSPVRRKTLLQN